MDGFALQGRDAFRSGAGCGHGGNGRNALLHGCTANRLFVKEGVLPLRGIDDEVDIVSLDQIDDVRAPFLTL